MHLQIYWSFFSCHLKYLVTFFFHSSTAGRGDFVVWSQGLPGEQGRGFDGQEPRYGPYPAIWMELLGGCRIYGSVPDRQYTLLLCGKKRGGVQLKTVCAVNWEGGLRCSLLGEGIKGKNFWYQQIKCISTWSDLIDHGSEILIFFTYIDTFNDYSKTRL